MNELPKLKKVDTSTPKVKKKKILLLSDDLRMHSGIATMSKEFVINTIDKYDWVQAGGAIKHPDEGKILDLSEDVRKETGVQDASLKIYPVSGYGNADLLRELLMIEQPDAIVHFTDPRFWIWLYQIEHEIRQQYPLIYYNIWDDLPDPKYNKPYYESCDQLLAISKQTYGINKRILEKSNYTDWQIKYVPHGVSDKYFFPIDKKHSLYTEFNNWKQKYFKKKSYDFVLLVNNRNIRRKNIIDIIQAYKVFCDSLKPAQAKKCALLLHTNPIDNNGTDLVAAVNELCPQYTVLFSGEKATTEELNFLYNACDVTINVASNEGFGLTTCESLMAGTPIIVNVTGGLQDQCGFKIDGKYVTADDYVKLGSLHDYEIHNPDTVTYGEWVIPIWPATLSIKGSVPTPYIYDDTCNIYDIVNAITEMYEMPSTKRKEVGLLGREFVMGDGKMSSTAMGEGFKEAFEDVFKNWKPRKRFTLCEASSNITANSIDFLNINTNVKPNDINPNNGKPNE